jgi:hypothetical protein
MELKSSFAHGIFIKINDFHIVFLTAAPVTALGFILALSLREVPLRTSHDYAAARDEAAGEAIG